MKKLDMKSQGETSTDTARTTVDGGREAPQRTKVP